MKHWLMKSEPDVFSIDDLARDGRTTWEGVRNYQARNFLSEMRVGDLALYYHSNASPSGVAGVGRIARTAYPDPTQFDPRSEYHDPASPPDKPRWVTVEVEFVAKLPQLVPLETLKAQKALAKMLVVQKGQRLSVQPVTPGEFNHVLKLGGVREKQRA